MWFPPCFVRQNQQKTYFFLPGNFWPFPNKNVQIWDHFFPLLFPKDYEYLKILDIRFWEVGAKRRLKGTSKGNTRTDGHTDTQTDILTYRKHRPRGPILWKLADLANILEEVLQKKISFNIFICGTSSTSASEEEAPATEEDIHMGNTPTLSPLARGNKFESVGAPSFGECLRKSSETRIIREWW